ncbi:MAG: DUF5317 family protein [Acidimicrobiales bacterium]
MIVIGLVVGTVRRGRLSALLSARLRRPMLLVVAVTSAAAVDLLDPPSPVIWAVVGLVAGLAYAASNLLVAGMGVIAIGVATNLVPVALNGSMPVRADALVEAGIVADADLDRVQLRGARELADEHTVLEILGDVIPVPTVGQVVSFGDLIVLVGLADVVANLMRRRRPLRLPRGTVTTLAMLGWDRPITDGTGEVLVVSGERIDLREPIPRSRRARHPGHARVSVARTAMSSGLGAPPPRPMAAATPGTHDPVRAHDTR